ncbi:sensor histidine kinase [Flavisolibacter ginsenosidimutans]|uniref:histidine kinase n=1 Tax=Flavisolibacter ginsenosidimutans TaxID=661481 RepID=A0A5B8UP95_9BACT|nr:HAMP domain-containing sensor histidine kinase [Flavisolibacter ginsenosidimutans]QEC58276.1 GHKL domain-containing protein [Flavisolibacter ginsenosidimutans]
MPKSSLLVTAAVLIALSFLSTWFFQSKPSVTQQRRELEDYVQKREKEAKDLLADTALLRKLISHTETEQEFDKVQKKKFGLFVFAETLTDNQDLLFWNSQEIIPPAPNFSPPDSLYFQHLLNGYYVVQKAKLALPGITSNMMAYALIPVLNKFYLETKNSQTQFAYDEDAINRITIAELPTEFAVRSVSGPVLFYITQASGQNGNNTDAVTFLLRMFSLLLVLVYLHLVVETVRRKRGAVTAVFVLALILASCRLLLFFFPGLLSLRQISLFDPTNYASDSFNRSLGDLLITSLFLCWLMLFAWSSLGPVKRLPRPLKGKGILVAGVAAIFVLIYTTFQLASVVHALVTNSKISFDVTDFFSLNIYSFFGFIVLALLTLSYYYFSRLLFRFSLSAFPNLLHLYFVVAVVGLTYLTLRSGNTVVLFQLPVLAWLVLYTLLLSREQLIINRIRMTVTGILFWLFVFSVSLAGLILQGNREREWETRKEIAEKYDQLSDPAKEHSLQVALAYLNNDFLRANFSRFYHEPGNKLLRDSIINDNLLGYSGSYATSLYVFDSTRQPVNNGEEKTYEALNNILASQSKPTVVNNLFYYETMPDQFVYITKREVTDSGKALGTLFIVAAPRQFQKKNELYPNLFVRGGENDLENSSQYAYAIYKDQKLWNHSSKYAFPTKINSAQISGEFEKVQNDDNDELWFKAGKQKVVVIAKKRDTFIETITLFSYLFCAFLFMVGLLRFAGLLVQLARGRRLSDIFSRLTIRTEIHATIIFISVLSFLIIGVATIQFFAARYKRNNVDRLSRVSSSAVTEMEKRVKDDSLLINNALNFSDSASRQSMRNVIQEISDVHGVIVNLYDLSGTLQVTSDEMIYTRGVLSTKMHPRAFYELNTRDAVQQVQNEKAGQLEYLSIYTAIRNNNGEPYVYLNIPSFTSQIELNQEISNFLVTIINLNAFIFLIAGVIALFITNRISHSFSVIGEKMKAITLGRSNEEITWTKDDEIGELVKQYNKMVQQLEQSAEALAKSEREGAWREMARQVAHEIKNPLTPMKLSIQYLQRAIQTAQPNVKDLTTNVAGTLIEQIDHLAKIAADFSQFANIGNKRVEKIDLHGVIGSLVSLYDANPHIELTWKAMLGPVWVMADKTQMNRLFTNLLTNAVDACSEERKCIVTIGESIEDETVIISVADNGEGIPAEMQSKIFTPNFTTKTSGTGLGLAMCKSIAEQAGGGIWFQTKEGEGTTFYVRLPVSE